MAGCQSGSSTRTRSHTGVASTPALASARLSAAAGPSRGGLPLAIRSWLSWTAASSASVAVCTRPTDCISSNTSLLNSLAARSALRTVASTASRLLMLSPSSSAWTSLSASAVASSLLATSLPGICASIALPMALMLRCSPVLCSVSRFCILARLSRSNAASAWDACLSRAEALSRACCSAAST